MRRLERKPKARADIKAIRAHSRLAFGIGAQRKYGTLMKRAFELLCADPQRASVHQREDLPGLHFFHLRYARTRGAAPKQARHIIVFIYDDTTLTVLRVLHDSMDITERVDDETSET
ncbi:MAG: type II toxin-antitoxin system RelE/ParE family toxin [Caulobacterales bacterium]|jgi:plasmid stabilization system protein ParE|nr:type II toxin-antitoxin system RelE/ParE family toxin [Caulobacterales bacterium]